jgi:hypothetical protein
MYPPWMILRGKKKGSLIINIGGTPGCHLAVTRQHDSMAMLARNLNIGRRYRFFIYIFGLFFRPQFQGISQEIPIE